MTDESRLESPAMDPAGKAEDALPTRDERNKALVSEFSHAMTHNAPMTGAMLSELKALLSVE